MLSFPSEELPSRESTGELRCYESSCQQSSVLYKTSGWYGNSRRSLIFFGFKET